MTDEERANFDRAQHDGVDAAERAKFWAERGNVEQAERYLIQAARELDAALQAVGSIHRVRVEPEP